MKNQMLCSCKTQMMSINGEKMTPCRKDTITIVIHEKFMGSTASVNTRHVKKLI